MLFRSKAFSVLKQLNVIASGQEGKMHKALGGRPAGSKPKPKGGQKVREDFPEEMTAKQSLEG